MKNQLGYILLLLVFNIFGCTTQNKVEISEPVIIKKEPRAELLVEGPINNKLRVIIENQKLLDLFTKKERLISNNSGIENLLEEISQIQIYHDIKNEKTFDHLIVSFKNRKIESIDFKDDFFIYYANNKVKVRNFRHHGTRLLFPTKGNVFISKEDGKHTELEEVSIEHLSSHCQLIIKGINGGFIKKIQREIYAKIYDAEKNARKILAEEKTKSERARLREKYGLE